MKRLLGSLTLLVCLLLARPSWAFQALVDPDPLDRGAAAALVLTGLPPSAQVEAEFQSRPLLFAPGREGLVGLFGAEVTRKAGRYKISLRVQSGGSNSVSRREIEVEVRDKDYGTRSLTVPRSQVELSPADLARVRQEQELVRKALAVVSPRRMWEEAFLRPAPGEVISKFGRRSVINNQPRRLPHLGVDLRGVTGDPVQAPAAGRVILTGEHFFSGRSIYLDHGQGLITMFFHLSRIDVRPGQPVARGEIVGQIGATGRVTGPHLHYGVFLNGGRYDPLTFQALTEKYFSR